MKQRNAGMRKASPLFWLLAVFSTGVLASPQGRRVQACREVVEAQRVLIDAQERMIDTLQRQLDACNSAARPPAEPPTDPPSRPPQTDPPDGRPPVFPPPGGSLTCEELRDRVVVDVERDRAGSWRVLGDGNWSETQLSMSLYGPTPPEWEGDWKTADGGNTGGVPFTGRNVMWAGAYQCAALQHYGLVTDTFVDGFVVFPNPERPNIVFGVKKSNHVVVDPHQDQFGLMKWGFRVYDEKDSRWINGWLNGGGTDNGVSATKEHSIYSSPRGNTEYGWLLIEDWGGQAIQVASRAWNQSPHNEPWVDGDFLWFHDICMHENGRNLGRASFPLTVAFNRQTDASDVDEHGNQIPHQANVLIERIHIRSTEFGGDTWGDGNPIHAKGGILVRGSDSDPNGWTFAGVFVSDVILTLDGSDRAMMQYRNIEELTVTRIDAEDVTGNRRVDLHAVGALHWTGNDTMNGVTVRYCDVPGAGSQGHTHNWITSENGTETFELINGVRQEQVDGR